MVSTQRQRIHPQKFTVWVAIASILMMFAGLTSAYIVKSSQAGWEGVQTPISFWYSTGIILASSLTMQLALRAFKQKEWPKYRGLMLLTLVLGVAFITLQGLGFNWMWEHGVRFKGAGAGQFLYIIAGLHALHVIGGVIALVIMALNAYTGNTRNYNSVPVEVMATYWHFVDVLWLYLFIFFIIIG